MVAKNRKCSTTVRLEQEIEKLQGFFRLQLQCYYLAADAFQKKVIAFFLKKNTLTIPYTVYFTWGVPRTMHNEMGQVKSVNGQLNLSS